MFEIWPLFPQMNPRLHLLKTSKTLHPTHHDGDGGYCGHRSVGHRFPGIVRGAGGRVSPSLLPSAQPAASLRVQVNTKALLFLTSPVLLFPRSHVSEYLIRKRSKFMYSLFPFQHSFHSKIRLCCSSCSPRDEVPSPRGSYFTFTTQALIFISPLRPTVDLIGAMETQSEPSELELDDVVITNPHIEAILENEEWIEDASYGHFTMSFSAVIMIIIHKFSIISHLSAVFSSHLW